MILSHLKYTWLRFCIVASITLCSATTLVAQETSAASKPKDAPKTDVAKKKQDLNVVVTATSYPTALNKIGGSYVQVMTKKEIKRKGYKTAVEALQHIPGITIATTGTLGPVRISGLSATNTLVLLDGVSCNDTHDHSPSLDGVLASSIERIEIVRGSQAAIYGSNASGGVINIITNGYSKKPYEVHIGIEGGSYRTWLSHFNVSGTVDKLNYSVGLSLAGSQGYSAGNARNDKIIHEGNTSEKDGWKKMNTQVKLRYHVTDDWSVYFTHHYFSSRSEYDDNYNGMVVDRTKYVPNPDPTKFGTTVLDPGGLTAQRVESDKQILALGTDVATLDKSLKFHLDYSKLTDHIDNYNNDDKLMASTTGWNNKIKGLASYYIGAQVLTLATSFNKEKYRDNKKQAIHKQHSKAAWLQDQIILLNDDLVLLATLRHDSYSSFGGATTYHLAPSYHLPFTNTTFKFAYGTGFKTPSLNQLYMETWGNPDLEPEKSKTIDATIEQGFLKDELKFNVSYFNYKIDNLIGYDPNTYVNMQVKGQSEAHGYITKLSYDVPQKGGAQISYIRTSGRDGDSNPIARVAKNKVLSDAYMNITSKLETSLSFIYAGPRTESIASRSKDKDGNKINELDAYALLNAAVQYQVTDNWLVKARVDNITNKMYEESWAYATPGRSAYLGTEFVF